MENTVLERAMESRWPKTMGKLHSPLWSSLSLPVKTELWVCVEFKAAELDGVRKRGQTGLQSPRSSLGFVLTDCGILKRSLPYLYLGFLIYNMRSLYKAVSKLLSVLIFWDLNNLLFGSSSKKEVCGIDFNSSYEAVGAPVPSWCWVRICVQQDITVKHSFVQQTLMNTRKLI